jgi:hypothetical protein
VSGGRCRFGRAWMTYEVPETYISSSCTSDIATDKKCRASKDFAFFMGLGHAIYDSLTLTNKISKAYKILICAFRAILSYQANNGILS